MEKGTRMKEKELKKYFVAVQDGFRLEKNLGRKDHVLVIAPHPDDDVLGAGGTMAAFAAQGKKVFSVYVTDGRGSPRKDASAVDEEMALRREREARKALRAVGAQGGFFLRKNSLQLGGQGGPRLKKDLAAIFDLIRPQVVLLPDPYERHRTHQICTRWSVEALRERGRTPLLYGYSLWGGFRGGKERVIRDISAFIAPKKKAVKAHASQLEYKQYLEGILGKNQSEAVFWETHAHQRMAFAEVFLNMSELLRRRSLKLEDFMRQDMEGFIQAYL
jgi:LmbE family N-acetylglucosaminyl deacetylase